MIQLDTELWKPGWKVRRARRIEREAWIMGGNYSSSLGLISRGGHGAVVRLPKARLSDAGGVARGDDLRGMRADLAPGWLEKFDREFLCFIWDFNARNRPQIVAMLAQPGGHLAPIVFRRDREVRQFLDGVRAN